MNEKNELSAKLAARRLGITLDAIYRLLAVGKLQGRKSTDDEWLIPAAAVEIRRKARMKLRRANQQVDTSIAVGA